VSLGVVVSVGGSVGEERELLDATASLACLGVHALPV
jgi:hypothetical protein